MLRPIVSLIILLGAAAMALAASAKPPVPPGPASSTIAVALIATSGIDYTDRRLAEHLARDGEGELIGYDLPDNDRRPYTEIPSHGSCPHPSCTPHAAALAVVQSSPAPNVAIFRAGTASGDAGLKTWARAMQMVSLSPARIAILIPDDDKDLSPLVSAAAQRFPDILVVRLAGSELAKDPSQAAPNVLTVAALATDCRPKPPHPVAHVVVAVPCSQTAATSATPAEIVRLDAEAAALAAVLVARLATETPGSKAADWRRQVLARAKPAPDAAAYALHGIATISD